jgi:hypothetical protein
MGNDPSSGYAPKAVRRRNFPFITCSDDILDAYLDISDGL